ncbi:hypothetical protein SLE2022_108390 [Rubroshorea leprosula]
MQSVVASLKGVSGLGNAIPYISFDIKAIAKQLSSLKNAITHQIQFKGKTIDTGTSVSLPTDVNKALLSLHQNLNDQELKHFLMLKDRIIERVKDSPISQSFH